MCWVDVSVNQQEATLAAQLNERRAEGPAATGFCLYCDKPLPEHMRWCNADCRDDWEHDQMLHDRGGLR